MQFRGDADQLDPREAVEDLRRLAPPICLRIHVPEKEDTTLPAFIRVHRDAIEQAEDIKGVHQ